MIFKKFPGRIVALPCLLTAAIFLLPSGGYARSFLGQVSDFISKQGLKAPPGWPPTVGQPYPDLELMDIHGRLVRLSQFKGKVLLIEPVGVPCAGSQAFAGGHLYGGYKNVLPQTGLDSIANYFPKYTGGLSLSSSNIEYIQILFYSIEMKAPELKELQGWARHFHMERHRNWHVLGAGPELVGPDAYAMIPGFQLIDRNFILRGESSGHKRSMDLYRELLPMVPKVLRERK